MYKTGQSMVSILWRRLPLGTAYQGSRCRESTRGKNVSRSEGSSPVHQALTANYMKPELPQMNVGDTVRVTLRVKKAP